MRTMTKPTRDRRILAVLAIILTLTIALLAMVTWPAPVQANVGAGSVAPAPAVQPLNPQYVLIAWNDLGMHCMNLFFKNLTVLPPYNTMWAQLIIRGDPPQITVANTTASYSIQGNTYSVGKTDFWTYAQSVFGLPNPLPDNIGLKGAGLAGDMKAAADHFIVEGVPLTPFLDSNPTVLYPYNLANLVAKDSTTSSVLAQTTAVMPVSTEMHCEYCHADGMRDGIATGNIETNILTFHDQEAGTTLMAQRPVLCAKCHGSNALGAPGDPNLPNLSLAMHGKHAGGNNGNGASKVSQQARAAALNDLMNPPNGVTPPKLASAQATTVCYGCHPGPQTQCLRDVMYQHGMTCTDCHGTMSQVANPARRPWIDVPRCGNCHKPQFAENPNTRYRDSIGHGGLYCEACHNSTHAIVPSTQYNDNIQNVALQGYAGALGKCTVCHLTQPSAAGPHGLTVPAVPRLRTPSNGTQTKNTRPLLNWISNSRIKSFHVQIRKDSTSGRIIANVQTTVPRYQSPKLAGKGTTYYWRVNACNLNLCSDWTSYWKFTVK